MELHTLTLATCSYVLLELVNNKSVMHELPQCFAPGWRLVPHVSVNTVWYRESFLVLLNHQINRNSSHLGVQEDSFYGDLGGKDILVGFQYGLNRTKHHRHLT